MNNIFNDLLFAPQPAPQPPRHFDVMVEQLDVGRAKMVAGAVDDGLLDGYYCQGKLWVSRSDLQDLLPGGHCTYDPDDRCCYIPDQSEPAGSA